MTHLRVLVPALLELLTAPATALSIQCKGLWVVCLPHHTEPADIAPDTYWVPRDWKSGQSDGRRAAEAPRVVQTWLERRQIACCCDRLVREGSQRWDWSWALRDIRKIKGEHSRLTQCKASPQTGWARTRQPTECDPLGMKVPLPSEESSSSPATSKVRSAQKYPAGSGVPQPQAAQRTGRKKNDSRPQGDGQGEASSVATISTGPFSTARLLRPCCGTAKSLRGMVKCLLPPAYQF